MTEYSFSFPFPWIPGSEFANSVVYTGILVIIDVLIG